MRFEFLLPGATGEYKVACELKSMFSQECKHIFQDIQCTFPSDSTRRTTRLRSEVKKRKIQPDLVKRLPGRRKLKRTTQ